jgi:CBS domain-containing protein
MRVGDVMTEQVRTAQPESALKLVAEQLSQYGIGGMPVIDGEMRPLGVITKADIVIKEWAEIPPGHPWRRSRQEAAQRVISKVVARTAGEAMSAPAVTVDPIMPLSVVAEHMLEHGVNRLPVVQRGRLVGIVTRHDLVRVFARSDLELEREIRDDALSGLSWPEALEMTVDGRRRHAARAGRLDRRGRDASDADPARPGRRVGRLRAERLGSARRPQGHADGPPVRASNAMTTR